MKYEKHPEPTMGIYIEIVDIRGQQEELHFAFNLAENSELAQGYVAWLAGGNTPEVTQPDMEEGN
jgi:hypothetical protein